MKLKRFLSFAVALCMVAAFIPAMTLTVSAAEETVLFDITQAGLTGGGDIALANGGWRGEAVFSGNWSETGTWNGSSDKALMFFRGGERGNNNGETKTATIDNGAYTVAAEKIVIEYRFAMQNASNNYQTWSFIDNDGKTFAEVYYDQDVKACVGIGGASATQYAINDKANNNNEVYALRGKTMRIEAVKGDANWTVSYALDGTALHSEEVDSINGFRTISANIGEWNNQYAAMALQGLKISYVPCDTTVVVSGKYTLNGEVIDTVLEGYDNSVATGAVFNRGTYYFGKGENYIYAPKAGTILSEDSEDTTVDLVPMTNWGTREIGEILSIGEDAYSIASGNLIPNGNFADGLNAWFNGANGKATYEKFRVLGDGTIQAKDSQGGSNPASLHAAWKITPGKQYYMSYYTDKNNEYQKVSQKDDISGTGDGTVIHAPNNKVPVKEGDYAFLFTATSDYVMINFRWLASNNIMGNFELYEVNKVEDALNASITYKTADGDVIYTETRKLPRGDSFTTETQEVYFAAKTGETCVDDRGKTLEFRSENAGYYILKSATVNAGDVLDGEVVEVANKYGVLKDTGGKSGGLYGVDNDNRAFLSTAGNEVRVDANGEALAESPAHADFLGGDRWALLKFELPKLKKGQKAALKVNVFKWHENGIVHNGSNPGLKLIAYAVNEDNWTEVNELNYDVTAMTLVEGTGAIFSEWATGLTRATRNTTVTFDVTEAVKAADAAGKTYIDFKISAPYGGAYITDREKAVIGNTSPYREEGEMGKAAYIEVVDANAFEVTATGSATLTKNGSAMDGKAYATADDDVRLVAEDALVVKTNKGYAYPNKNLALTETTELGTVEPMSSLGLTMVGGAQVRVGDGLTEDGKVGAGSGLRFVATVNKNDTVVADENVKFGMKISAEGSTAEPTYREATKFQGEYDDVFTVAITNLATANYNRNYIATPYALVPMIDGTQAEFNADSVARSIYKVSAGILKNNAFETEDYNNKLGSTILGVLNAYVNQVGIRLAVDAEGNFSVFNKDGSTGNYTGDVFFDVASEIVDGVVKVTVTPKTEDWANPVEIASWWKDYIRVNNNNKNAVEFIDGKVNPETGALEFTFTLPVAE